MSTLREQLLERREQWRLFNEWEAVQPPIERDPAAILADLGTILSWLPANVRTRDTDPDKTGIQKMRAALALLHN